METLPSINASLNLASTVLLILGYTLIRQRAITAHTICMLAACGTSTLFLVGYLYYHYHHGSTPFPGRGWVRPVYFSILISHTVLAAAVPFLVILTLYRAFRSQFRKHVWIARVTLPIWLYVSVTGVIVYWMLYRMKWS
jgi:uncharacterized membrane protein YozB (DUF420 family)